MKRHALFVGVDQYADPSIQDLRFAVNDATELAGFFKHGAKFDRAEALPNPRNCDAVLDCVRDLLGGLGAGDEFLFFFAGHGVTTQDGHRLVCAGDQLAAVRHAWAGLPLERLKFETAGNYNRLFLLDACRTDVLATNRGVVGAMEKGTRDLILATASPENAGAGTLTVLCSCDDGECAGEIPPLRHGLFSMAMLDLLDEEKSLGRRVLVTDEFVYGRLPDRMRILSENAGMPFHQKPQKKGPPILLLDGIITEPAAQSHGGGANSPSEPHGPATAAPVYVTCPVCGRWNKKTDTFKCRECGSDDLCLDHRDPKTFLCHDCIAKKARDEAARKAKEEAARKELELKKARANQERYEKERQAREADRLKRLAEMRHAEAARRATEEAERKAREEAMRKAREAAEATTLQERHEKERLAREADRLKRLCEMRKSRDEAARKAKDEAKRKAREEEERSAREEVPFVRKYRDGVYRGEQIVEGNVGHGVWEGTDGSRYEGEFLFGNGFFSLGEYHGHGVLVLPSGDRYDGDWQHGKKMGRGRYDWKSGTFYDGQWLWGKRHGKGVISYSDGDRYDGEWKNDVKCGYGTYTWPTGDSYVGDWMNGKKNGIGTYTYPDGDRYEGEWKDGKKNGIGTYTYSDGDRYEGEWKDDEKCGHGRIIKSDGRIQQDGEWQHNKFIGIENRKTAVIGANDPCPCGSGKKFKKCHGNMEKRAEFSGDTVGEMDALHSTRRLDSIIDELDEYDVKLVSIPRDRMIAVMGVVRQLTGFGPADAKSLVNGLGVVKAGLSKSEADEVRRKLEAAGATVAVHLS